MSSNLLDFLPGLTDPRLGAEEAGNPETLVGTGRPKVPYKNLPSLARGPEKGQPPEAGNFWMITLNSRKSSQKKRGGGSTLTHTSKGQERAKS